MTAPISIGAFMIIPILPAALRLSHSLHLLGPASRLLAPLVKRNHRIKNLLGA
jgi:hypothetical protein